MTTDSLGFSFKNSQISYSVSNPSESEFVLSVSSFVGGGINGSGSGGVQPQSRMRIKNSRFIMAQDTTTKNRLQRRERKIKKLF
jgi:hypothetical protein